VAMFLETLERKKFQYVLVVPGSSKSRYVIIETQVIKEIYEVSSCF
jgi:hypothetical protein